MTNDIKAAATMTCMSCAVACQRFGKHRNGLRRFRCPQCKRTYTENHRRTLGTMYISEDRAVLALQLLLEGNSIRSTERITGLDRNTIMTLLVRAGERCKRLMDEKMRNLHLKHLQIDEIWTYVQKKARRIRSGDSPDIGDQWVFVALDEDTKLIPAFHIGKRHQKDTRAFLWDLYGRISGRTQITTDGLHHYTAGVPDAFGLDCDFANSSNCLANGDSMTPKRGTPQVQSSRCYPRSELAIPILTTSAHHMWNGRI